MSYLFSSNPRKLLCSLATVMRCRLQLMDVKRRREKLTVFFGFCIFSLYILFYRNKETAGKPFLWYAIRQKTNSRMSYFVPMCVFSFGVTLQFRICCWVFLDSLIISYSGRDSRFSMHSIITRTEMLTISSDIMCLPSDTPRGSPGLEQ